MDSIAARFCDGGATSRIVFETAFNVRFLVDRRGMFQLTDLPIDVTAALAEVTDLRAGATVLFLGTVRGDTAGRGTLRLEYEAYREMAVVKLAELEAEARRRWGLLGCVLIHRVGTLQPGETSVAVAVSAAHRDAAFEAGRWLIDTLKATVPLWKCEHWDDGSREWVGWDRASTTDGAPYVPRPPSG